ncbi:MAG: hypothetical protein GY761_03910 [Hyphomicrobiales bacterium]|nr:hypothetical protein [Hyphomicrobiales bacterium]
MSANLKPLLDAIRKVDPARISKLYPTREQYDEYVHLRQRAEFLFEQVTPGGLPIVFNQQLEKLTSDMKKAANNLAPDTDLGGRLQLNRILVWAEAHHLERAIYLAGQCEALKIREPFRTQIRLQPANACMTRYRQVFQILEFIQNEIQAEPGNRIGITIAGMLRALLEQFEYFAFRAKQGNENHVFACYMLALSHLFRAHEQLAANDNESSANYLCLAQELINNIEEPSVGQQRVELSYHVNNWGEFSGFKRLSQAHPDISRRLEFLADKSQSIIDAEGYQEEKSYFWFSSYVGGTARAASIVGLVCATAGALGIDLDTARNAIENTWEIAIQSIPGLQENSEDGGKILLQNAHTGGLAYPSVATLHTGGLGGTTDQWISQMRTMIHTGGLA